MKVKTVKCDYCGKVLEFEMPYITVSHYEHVGSSYPITTLDMCLDCWNKREEPVVFKNNKDGYSCWDNMLGYTPEDN